jgi:hypothetical protein
MLRARADSEVRDPARLAACSLRSLSQVGIVEPRSPTQLGTVTQSQVGADRQARSGRGFLIVDLNDGLRLRLSISSSDLNLQCIVEASAERRVLLRDSADIQII